MPAPCSAAASLPNPGDPGFPAVLATFFAFLGGAAELARSRSWERVQGAAFKLGFLATGAGIGFYLFGLVDWFILIAMDRKSHPIMRELLINWGAMFLTGAVVITIAKLLDWSNGALGTALILVLAVVVLLIQPIASPRD